jgi:hypothetical protein
VNVAFWQIVSVLGGTAEIADASFGPFMPEAEVENAMGSTSSWTTPTRAGRRACATASSVSHYRNGQAKLSS